MSHADFVHLRVHSAYSLSEGAIRVKDLNGLCNKHKMPAVAVTDTNNLFGALEFSLGAVDGGVQPIIGVQIAVSREGGDNPSMGRTVTQQRPDTVVLLVQNDVGYRNILKLLSTAYMDSDDVEDPQVTIDHLQTYSDGLILLTGGVHGPVGRMLVDGQVDHAEACLERLLKAYPGRVYIELQRHGLKEEAQIEAQMIDWAYAKNVPLVATNEAFFVDRNMFQSHDALICIAAGAYVSQDQRRRLTTDHYFKSPEEMKVLFADVPEAIANTLVVAQRCAFKVERVKPILPPFDCGEGRNEQDELRKQSRDGLERRLEAQVFTPGLSDAEKEAVAKPYRERLEFELGVIIQMGFPGYFLIVADFIQWAKDHDIPVGPGRGSGAGSVVAWVLTITDLDPLRFGLLFERFLNPERVSMPDFDIDFCQDRRDEVIKYVQDKYGRDHVAQIITFGKLQARAVLRDVGRVLEMPYGQVDRICKMVPNDPGKAMSLPEAVEAEPELRRMIKEEHEVARLIEIAKPLEGLYRHASTHAAGVVIGDRPLDQLVPLYRDPRSDMPVTGFNMKYVEQVGLVKFDFLGLKTLTVLSTAVKFALEGGNSIDLTTVPLDDQPSFDLLQRAETQGVFQLESAGMKDQLRGLRPTTFEDIIAIVALYRPGPMENIPSYIRRKHGDEQPDYMYPTLEPILKETFGIIIYQEQVMQIAQELSGYSLGGADLLRRAMGKKNQEEMDKQRAQFIEGAVARGVPSAKADQIFDHVNKFAGYGFNKSHAAAYALVAYHTAYMKANFPYEFMAASMTLDLGNTDKLNAYRQELDRMGVKLLSPDINASETFFKVERGKDGKPTAIRYALAALKNVGEAAMASLIGERAKNGPFKDLEDFAGRLDTHQVNKRQMENMVRSGTFDSLNPNRRQLHQGIEAIMSEASAQQSDRESNQIGLFGGGDQPKQTIRLPDVADWPPMERLREEFDAIGFYLSAHPLDSYGKSLQRLEVVPFSKVLARGQSGNFTLAGTVVSKKERISQKGKRYAFVTCSDASGSYEVMMFSETLAASADLLEPGTAVLIKATAQFEGETVKLLAQSMRGLDKMAAQTSAGLQITITDDKPLADLQAAMENAKPGRGEVRILVRTAQYETSIALKEKPVSVTPELLHAVYSIAGIAEVQEI
ncbi:DNA polymerase III subunit alpha [Magnetovibrio blakemorei]|uniref:DNA polymerase III subunit alpha n=1 Tax=Magnetovibrio blakemorei TaxID=28181 RepID=A0A1E5Q9Y6_9PROT|nr:DNA polymerase III subunit alpha [Magnetovibrio blakemorei]OEJ68017.1 DNA polymerase III subunit alpha [Magnetovibrio blakemorei]